MLTCHRPSHLTLPSQLTSYSGFIFYFCTSLLAALILNACSTKLQPAEFFKNGFTETATQGLIGNLMGYLLCELIRALLCIEIREPAMC